MSDEFQEFNQDFICNNLRSFRENIYTCIYIDMFYYLISAFNTNSLRSLTNKNFFFRFNRQSNCVTLIFKQREISALLLNTTPPYVPHLTSNIHHPTIIINNPY